MDYFSKASPTTNPILSSLWRETMEGNGRAFVGKFAEFDDALMRVSKALRF